MRKSLFDINTEYLQAIEELEQYCLERETDEVPEHLQERLNINQNEMKDKLDAYAHVIMEMKGQVDVLDFEINRLKRRKDAIDNSIKGLKALMAYAVKHYGNTTKTGSRNFKTDTVSISYISTLPVVITDLVAIPEHLTRVKVKETSLTRKGYQDLILLLIENGFTETFQFEIEPKKKEIQDILKNFNPVPGAKLDEEAGYIRIS